MTFSKIILLAAASITCFACGDDSASPGNDPADAGIDEPPPSRPQLGTQIDRTGRPAVSTALMDTFSGDVDAKGVSKDAYNAAGPSQWASFAASFEGSLAILDALDTVCGNQLLADDTNPDGRYATLAGILADDQLYVNSASGECGVYLGLEAEIVGAIGAGDGKCGGRTLKDDIIERSYSVLAAGALAGIDDTVASDDDCTQSSSFPYLCAPTL